jgi:hypothetical protein
MKTTPMKIQKMLMMFAAMMVLLGAMNCSATSYTFNAASGVWNSAANWTPNTGYPGSGDTAIIPTADLVTGLGGSSQACATLTIQGSGTVTVDANTLTVSGVTTVGSSGGTGAKLTISLGATFAETDTASGAYGFAGTTPSIVNNGTFTCAGGASYSTGSFGNNGTTTFTGSQQAFNGTIAVTQGANATLNLNSSSSTPFGGSCTLSATATGNTVVYTTGQNSYGTTYYNLAFSGASPSAGSGTHVNGTLTLALNSGAQVNSAGNITFGSGANIIRTLGALSGTPAFSGTVNVTYNGASSMTTGSELPTSGSALENLTITDTAGVILNANATVNGVFSATYNGSTVPLAAGSKTLAFVNSPVNITVSGSALASANNYTIVSSSGTTVSGSLGTVTVTGSGAPYTSPTASTSTGQLVLSIPNCTATTAAPSITTSTICPGSTSISGTSASGASIVVYDMTASTQIGTATASGTSWTATITAAVAGHTITATAQVSGQCTSSASTGVTVQTGTAAPGITAPIYAGSTSISGTSASGASIVVYDLTASTQIGTATASGTSWTAAVTALTAGHSIAATAQAGNCVSPDSTAVTVQSVTTTTNTLAIVSVANTNINAGTYLTIPTKVLTNGVPAN